MPLIEIVKRIISRSTRNKKGQTIIAGINFGAFNNPYLPKATTLKANTNQVNKALPQDKEVVAKSVSIKCNDLQDLQKKAQSGNYEGWQLYDVSTGKLYKVVNGKAVEVKQN